MTVSSSSTHLVIGLAALGMGLVVAGVRMSRRKAARAEMGVEATSGDEHAPGEVAVDGTKVPPEPHTGASGERRLLAFLFFTFALAVPFWLFGGGKLPLPINLPVGALATFVPMSAACLVAFRYDGFTGVRQLLKRAVDFRKIRNKAWYLLALLLMPSIYLLSYAVMRLAGRSLPEPVEIPLLMVPVFLVMFFVGGIGEELGWTGYALDPMQKRWGAAGAGLLLGAIWVVWHTIPWVQTGNTAGWIVWQGVFSVALRMLIVWIYNTTGKSVVAAVLVHAASNTGWSLFPNYGTHYDPFVTSLVAWLAVLALLVVWEPATLARLWRTGARN